MSRVLLLTGATGMVGREILSCAVDAGRFDEIRCVVRGSDRADSEHRLQQVLAEPVRTAAAASGVRVSAITGDLTEPGLAADPRAFAGVTDVIHGAASVAFDLPLDQARAINVTGTRHVLDVCRNLPRLHRIDAISTCYVAGRRTGVVRESELLVPPGFANTYEQSKFESEQVLRAAMAELPIAVHRPSIVVGNSRTGQTGAWKVLYWPLKVIAHGRLPVIPYDPDCRLDIVPVDFVADAVLALNAQPGAIGRTFHLAAGTERDTTAGELFPRIFRQLHRRPPVRVPPRLFRHVVRPVLQVAPSARLRRTLRQGLVYRPYLELRVAFDTERADAALLPVGVRCPRVTDYIDTIVAAAIESDFGARNSSGSRGDAGRHRG